MDLIDDGLRSLARNFSTLLLGSVLVFIVSGAYYFATALALDTLYPELLVAAGQARAAAETNTGEIITMPSLGQPPLAYVLVNILSEVALAIAISVVYALVFARLGRLLDRPLWKCASDAEAVRRFFMPWFILTLSTIALRDAQGNSGSVELYLLIETTMIFLSPFVVPIGTCVMHHGALNWEEIGAILTPIGRQFRMIIPVLLVGILQYMLQEWFSSVLPNGPEAVYTRAAGATLCNVPIWIMDALVFCMMWRVCMLDRDAALNSYGHDDFD